MSNRDDFEIPDAVKQSLRAMLLKQIKGTSVLDVYELELFEWYVKETETLLTGILSTENAFIQEQVQSGTEDINDSGMVAVDYYLKRVRYSHVIYMASLLETFLERSCEAVTMAIGEQNLPFTTAELKGDQWSVKRKFLERYGKFSIPNQNWSDIQALITLRNNLVHDNGDTSELKASDKRMLAKRQGIMLDGNEVVIDAAYIHEAFRAIKSLVRFMEEKIGFVVERAISPKLVA